MMQPVPQRIVWIYGQWQSAYDELKEWWKENETDISLEFGSGIETIEEVLLLTPNYQKKTLLVLDDVMHEADERVTKLFTKGSHHLNLSVMFLVQNLFHGANKEHRTISLNTQYLIVMKNPRDGRQIEYLANQMYPGQSHFLREAFADATRDTPHSYLMLDLKQSTPDAMRVRTNIFPTVHETCSLPSSLSSYLCTADTVYVPSNRKV